MVVNIVWSFGVMEKVLEIQCQLDSLVGAVLLCKSTNFPSIHT